MNTDVLNTSEPLTPSQYSEVRFSVHRLLRELKAERTSGAFGMEKLDRYQIAAIFKARTRLESCDP